MTTTGTLWQLVQGFLDERAGMPVFNPATGERIAAVRTYTAGDVADIIPRSEQARRDWAALTAKARAERLRDWYVQIMAHRDLLAALCTAECGKPLHEALGEVAYAASFIEWFAEEAKRAYGETIPAFGPGNAVMTVKEPVGTCAAITPWNFPLAMVTRKVGPALAAGCAMIVKPAETTPLSALALEALARQAGIPADLFRVVPSSDPAAIGALFCKHPVIRKISFTGSTPVGKQLLAQAAGSVKRVSMELGGNAPFIVFADADLDAAGARFFAPTVLTDVAPDMAIARTEIFGPVAAVTRFADEQDALRLANDTPFGLAAYVYARDVGVIWRMMAGLEYGMVAINDGALSTETAPFGGIKESGLGREGSRHGLDEYLELKYALIGGLSA